MELADNAEGETLSPGRYVPHTLVFDLKRRGRLPLPEVLRLAIRIAGALSCLHEHALVHRDAKPSNIIFVKGWPKLADIGLVAALFWNRSLASPMA